MKNKSILTILGICFLLFSCYFLVANLRSPVMDKNDLLCTKEGKIYICTYKDLKEFTGTMITKNSEGRIVEEAEYENSKPNGITKVYRKNGKLFFEITMKDGKRDGSFKWYYESGKVNDVIMYKDDKKNGIERKYHENGSLSSEVNWIDGKKEGLEKEYDEKGFVFWERPYKNGKLDGTTKLYNEDGSIAVEEYWEDEERKLHKIYFKDYIYENRYKDGKLYKTYIDGEEV